MKIISGNSVNSKLIDLIEVLDELSTEIRRDGKSGRKTDVDPQVLIKLVASSGGVLASTGMFVVEKCKSNPVIENWKTRKSVA